MFVLCITQTHLTLCYDILASVWLLVKFVAFLTTSNIYKIQKCCLHIQQYWSHCVREWVQSPINPAKLPSESLDTQNALQAPQNRLRASNYHSKPLPFCFHAFWSLKKIFGFYIHKKTFFSNNHNMIK